MTMKPCSDRRCNLYIKSTLTSCSGLIVRFYRRHPSTRQESEICLRFGEHMSLGYFLTERATRMLSRARGGEKRVSRTVDLIALVIPTVVPLPRELCTNLSFSVDLGSSVIPSARYLHILIRDVGEVLKGSGCDTKRKKIEKDGRKVLKNEERMDRIG